MKQNIGKDNNKTKKNIHKTDKTTDQLIKKKETEKNKKNVNKLSVKHMKQQLKQTHDKNKTCLTLSQHFM